MGNRMTRLSYRFMAVSAVGVALYSLRYVGVPFGVWALVDTGIAGVIARVPVQALMHMLIAPIPLLIGPFQFISSLRARQPKVHRYLGRIYVVTCVMAGLGALAVAPHASGGPVAGWGFGILAVLWIASALGGWWSAMRRKFELHRLAMRLSYAMTFGAVTLRLQIPLGLMLGYHSYSEMSVWLAYTSWIPNVIAVLAYTALERARKHGSARGELAMVS
jgi:uncharacterized membrane protein